jgi:RimJ/RimL family protein N-acetyltransferase
MLALTPLGVEHLARTLEWTNDGDLARPLNRTRRVEEAEHRAWFEGLAGRTDCAYFAIELENERRHVGNVWLWDIDERHRKAEARIVVGDAAARGRGIGPLAIDAMCRYGFSTRRLHRIYAFVLAINPGAKRAFEKAGFALEGILRDDRWSDDRFVDAYVMARLGGT